LVKIAAKDTRRKESLICRLRDSVVRDSVVRDSVMKDSVVKDSVVKDL